MAVLTQEQVRELAGFRPQDGVVTSCYLDVDGRRFPRKAEYEQELDRLLRQARARINGSRLVARDLHAIEQHVQAGIDRSRTRGLAMFACGAEGFWTALALPVPVRSQLVVGHGPAVGQLEAALHHYEPIGVLLVDSHTARVLVFELGELTDHAELVDDLLRDEEPRDERPRGETSGRVDDQLHRHARRAAAAAVGVYQQHPFAHLLLGGPNPVLSHVEDALHPYLQERLRTRVALSVAAPVATICDQVLEA